MLDTHRYTQKRWGKKQRREYLAALDAAFHRLAEHPEHGRVHEHIRAGYRRLEVRSHVIFYRITDAQITIVRVLHGNRDIDRLI